MFISFSFNVGWEPAQDVSVDYHQCVIKSQYCFRLLPAARVRALQSCLPVEQPLQLQPRAELMARPGCAPAPRRPLPCADSCALHQQLLRRADHDDVAYVPLLIPRLTELRSVYSIFYNYFHLHGEMEVIV